MATDTVNTELIQAQIATAMANTMKLGAETAKINAEARYYPIVALGAIAVSALGALAAIVAGLLKLFS